MPCSGDPSPQGTSSTLSSRHPSGMEPCWPVSPAHQHRWTAYPFPQRCVPWTPAALWVPSDGLGTSAIMEPKCPHGALPPSPGSGAGLHLSCRIAATTCNSMPQSPKLVPIAGLGALAQDFQGTLHPSPVQLGSPGAVPGPPCWTYHPSSDPTPCAAATAVPQSCCVFKTSFHLKESPT